MDPHGMYRERPSLTFGVSDPGGVATLPAPMGTLASRDPSISGASPVSLERSGEFAWMCGDIRPNEQETLHAIEVISAVPLAAAVGWSVRGNQWTTHPRRLRTAVVSPSDTWDIEVMRGVREVDCLSGTILVRVSSLEQVDGEAFALLGEDRVLDEDTTRSVTRAMRSAGFRLLYLGVS